MREFYPVYICLWSTACVVAIVLYVKDRKTYAISQPEYRRFIFKPWKIITFLIAATGLTLVAPYTGDPTWDYCDSIVMSVLTFFTAPWAVGVAYRTCRGVLPKRQAYVAACVWLFSVSWFYDTYILLRDGEYTPLWLPNLFASSALYAFAGLLWNLDWRPHRGTIFAFMEDGRPNPVQGRTFHRIVVPALVFMILVFLMVLFFLVDFPVKPPAWLSK